MEKGNLIVPYLKGAERWYQNILYIILLDITSHSKLYGILISKFSYFKQMYLLFFEVDFQNTPRYICLAYMGHKIKISGALKEQNQGEPPPSLSPKGLPQHNSFLLLHWVRWALIPLDSFGRYLTDDWWSGWEESLHQVKTSGLDEAEIEGHFKIAFL